MRISWMTRYLKSIALLFVLAALASAAPAKGASKPKSTAKPSASAKMEQVDIYVGRRPPFDSAKIRKLYLDGDFEEAIELIDVALREKRSFNHGDSVFFCKHLGVMYAAKYDTREKGKYYMHMLLMVEPTARILDMYASDMIYMIFKNIQDEFDATRMRLGRAEQNWKGNQADSMPVAKTPEPKPEPKASNSHALVWVGATTAVAAAGVAAYFIFSDTPATKHVNADFKP